MYSWKDCLYFVTKDERAEEICDDAEETREHFLTTGVYYFRTRERAEKPREHFLTTCVYFF